MTEQQRAHQAIRKAIKRGDLIYPYSCELCDHTPYTRRAHIVAHHWRGYSYPLDVWFICQFCSWILRDKHDGELTKAEARRLIESKSEGRRQYPTRDNPPTFGK